MGPKEKSIKIILLVMSLFFFLVEVWEPSCDFVRAGVKSEYSDAGFIYLKEVSHSKPEIRDSGSFADADNVTLLAYLFGDQASHSSVGLELCGLDFKAAFQPLETRFLLPDLPGTLPNIEHPPISVPV